MSALTTLYAGLDGAVGAAFIPSQNRLVFVEFDGELDALDLSGGTPAYSFLGDGYNEPEDIVVAADGVTAHITERVGNLLRVNLTSGSRADAMVVSGGMTAPHQMSLDEANNRVYLVEFANPGRLLRIDLSTGVQTVLAHHLHFAVGLVVTSDGKMAYVSEQPASGGRIRSVNLTTGFVSHIADGLTAPFFLTWLNASQDRILVPERDPANRLCVVYIGAGPTTPEVLVSGLGFRPSSVTVGAPWQLLIACDGEIDQYDLSAGLGSDHLLLGIGWVPVDYIVNAGPNAGRANTVGLTGVPAQFDYSPFGATLWVMVDHGRAWTDGSRYYRVTVDGTPRLDTWTELKWDPVALAYLDNIVAPAALPAGPGFYPVRDPALIAVATWYLPTVGSQMSTVFEPHIGLHTLTVEFTDPTGTTILESESAVLLIDNDACTAIINAPNLDGAVANSCGYLPYGAINADLVTIPFTASQPNQNAMYSFNLIKGGSYVAPTPLLSGPVASSPEQYQSPLDVLMGGCTVAGFAAQLAVQPTAVDGFYYLPQKDATLAFAIAPAGL